MSPVQSAFYVGVTVFNVVCMIISVVFWSTARANERKARRHKDALMDAVLFGSGIPLPQHRAANPPGDDRV